jgi:hypothetical protein
MDDAGPPILTAVSSSARQLYLLLRCIAFSPKAHVQISDMGLKLAVDEASVMEGISPYVHPFRILQRLTETQHPPSSTNPSSRHTPSTRPHPPPTPNTPTATTTKTSPRQPVPPPSRSLSPPSSKPYRSSALQTPLPRNRPGRATAPTPPAPLSPATTSWAA